LLAVGTAGLVLFVAFEARAANPLIAVVSVRQPGLFRCERDDPFSLRALSAVLFLLPSSDCAAWLTATQVGLTLAPFGVSSERFRAVAGNLVDRSRTARALVLGPVLLAVATSALAMNVESFWLRVSCRLLLMSFAMAIVVSAADHNFMNAAPDAQAGAASGINNATSRLAGLLAVAIAGALANILYHRGLEHRRVCMRGVPLSASCLGQMIQRAR